MGFDVLNFPSFEFNFGPSLFRILCLGFRIWCLCISLDFRFAGPALVLRFVKPKFKSIWLDSIIDATNRLKYKSAQPRGELVPRRKPIPSYVKFLPRPTSPFRSFCLYGKHRPKRAQRIPRQNRAARAQKSPPAKQAQTIAELRQATRPVFAAGERDCQGIAGNATASSPRLWSSRLPRAKSFESSRVRRLRSSRCWIP